MKFFTSWRFFKVSTIGIVLFLFLIFNCYYLWLQISSVFKSSYSCRGDWRESQSWCWIGTQNTCKLFLCWDAKVITWVENSLEKLDNELHVKVKKCVKLKACICFLISQPIIGCPLLRGKFCPKCSRGALNKCPL